MKKISLIICCFLSVQILSQVHYENIERGYSITRTTKNTFEYSSNNNVNNEQNDSINNGINENKPGDSQIQHIENSKSQSPRIENSMVHTVTSFDGPSTFNCWVPDCNIIPGPEDLLIAINTKFQITDKSGNLISEINTNNWFSEFIGTGLVFDPKCIYDKTNSRFIMTYLYYESVSDSSLMFLCVSDDSTAAGDWNIWALRGDLNGLVHADIYPDFPTLTITDNLIYWLNDMYPYNPPTGNPLYTKLRVIRKSEVMNSTSDTLNYKDLWGIKNPNNPNQNVRTLKLVHNLSASNDVYILGLPNPSSGSYTSIYGYKVNDDYDNLTIKSFNIPCSTYSMPPHMLHLGGGKPVQLWYFFYTEMIQRNGIIYAAHSIKSADPLYSEIHYMEIDTASMNLIDELYINKAGHSYGYPDMMADSKGNVFIVYNRSGQSEYPGVFYTAKPAKTNFFLEDIALQEGLGDFNIYCGNTTNPYIRFEDYTDIMFDLVDSNYIWIMGEYIDSDNKWKSRIGKILIDDIIISGIEELNEAKRVSLSNYPNPFNPSTTISFSLPERSFVRIVIYDALGEKIEELINTEMDIGNHSFQYSNKNLAGGVYYYQLQTNSFFETKKMVLLK
jgi:hypothetical protein